MTDVTQQRKLLNCNGSLLFTFKYFFLYNDFDMTVNHCLFLVHIDVSFILVALHLRMKPAQPTIILRFDLCVISKLELNKNALKSGGNSRLLGYWIRNEEAINFKRNRINSLKHALPTLLMVEYSSKSGYVLFLTFYIVFDDLFLN